MWRKQWQEMALSVLECLPFDRAPCGRHLPKGVDSNPEIWYRNSGYSRAPPPTPVTRAKPLNFRSFPIHHPPIFWPFDLLLTKGQAVTNHYILPSNTKLHYDTRTERTQIINLSRKHTQAGQPFLHSILTNIFLNPLVIWVIEIDSFPSSVTLKTHCRVLLVIHMADRASKIASYSQFILQNAWECQRNKINVASALSAHRLPHRNE